MKSVLFLHVIVLMALGAPLCWSEWQWEVVETKGQPVPRHEAGFIPVKNHFYLLGGRGIRPISIYDAISNEWKNGAKPPVEFHHFQAVSYEDKILIVTALTGAFPHEKPLEKILSYDPASDTWEWGEDIPAARRRGAAGVVRVGDHLYITGGIVRGHMGGFVNWHDRYDLKTGRWTRLPDAPRPRDHFQSAEIEGKIYAAGGRTTSKETKELFSRVIPEVDVYDIEEARWSTLPHPLPTPRAGHSTFALGVELIVAGGESSQIEAHREVEAWNLRKKKWIEYPPLVEGRHGTALLRAGHFLYTCSGSGRRGGSPELKSLERLSLPMQPR